MSVGAAERVVRDTVERFARGDRDRWRQTFAPDVVWDVSGDPLLGAAVYRGHDGVEEFFRAWLGAWEELEVENREFVEAGDSVLVVFRQRGRGKGSGIVTEREFYGVYDVAAGLVVRYRGFDSREEAEAALGLA